MSAADLFGDARLATLNRYPWAGQLLAKAPAVCVWILAAVLAWQLSGLVWDLFPSKPDDNVQLTYTTTASTDSDTATTQSANVAPIVEAHLFGEAKPEDAVPDDEEQGPVTDAPETNLPLELKGTLASDTPANALAIIADGRDEKVYRIDDVVRRGVTLHSVEAKRVLLSRAGTIEALNLPVPEETASTRPVVRRPTQSVSRQRPSVRETITSNASALTEIISPRPYYVGGQQRGFRLYPSRDRQKFASLGLRPGDIVTEINGMPLTNAQQAAQVFSQLADAQSVTVMLERNGKPQSMTLDVNQIENATQAD